MTGNGRSRPLFVVAAAIAAAVAVATVAAGKQGNGSSSASRFDPRKEAAFEAKGLEAPRKGPSNPAAEQVENRAYPRAYVDDRLALKSHEAFDRKPEQLGSAAFDTRTSVAGALAASPGAWSALGPVTPNVSGEASQFLDPVTLQGPTTQESGRVTALAIDPNCGKVSAPAGAPCRLWFAAAGGGIWRTDDALASAPSWIAPPDDLPTNAFGSLIIDPNDPTGNTLYAGSGEPNGSVDSEAGLGLFKSTDGGSSWQLVAGSQAVAINRSIGAIAVKPGDPSTIYIGTDVARHGSSSSNGGRRTPPGAPTLGVYTSTDGGAHFTLAAALQARTPANPSPPGAGTGVDWFQGGITKLELDPNNTSTVYAAVVGYGLWRSTDGGSARRASTRISMRSSSTPSTRASHSGARTRRLAHRRAQPPGQVGGMCDPEVRLHPRSARRPACAAGPDGLSAPAEWDPTDDHADQRRPEHDPVPVALVQPEQPDRRAPGRDAGQRHVLLHRDLDLARVGRRDGGQSGFDVGNPTIRYHNYYDATPEVNFHGNDPREWLDIYDPLQSTGELRSFYVPFIADPTVAGRAFIGLEHVWRTDANGGDPAYLEAHCNALHLDPNRKDCGDWKPMGLNLTGSDFGNFRVGHYVVATTRAPSDAGTLWAGTRIGRLFITSNANDPQPRNVRWVRLDTPTTPGRFVSGIAVDPADPNHAWISYSGYNAYTPTTPGHVLEARYNPVTGAATFTDRSYDLGDQPITGIAEFGPTRDLYAATDFGVLRLPSGASHWENAGTSLPSVAVYGLTLSQSAHVLYAATHGRGAYALSLPTS